MRQTQGTAVLEPAPAEETPRARSGLRLPPVGDHAPVYALLGAVTIAFSSILVRLSHASPS
ncbi:MAG: hypothetical protein WAK93_05215, partial [Solirubrobacteraceae bacterium]